MGSEEVLVQSGRRVPGSRTVSTCGNDNIQEVQRDCVKSEGRH